jgi:hypothetical protein
VARDPGAPLSLATRRFRAQLLSGPPARDALAATERLLAVQAQDGRGARLAIRARTSLTSVADFNRALGEERSIVVSWLNRGTLHLVGSDDYRWLHALTTPQLFTGNARRLSQEGVTSAQADRAVGVIKRALAGEGPLTRAQLGERIAKADVRTEGQALVHLLMLACLRGIALRGPMIGKQHAYVLADEWLERGRPLERDRSLSELALRYLAGHGPADDRDLARWAGITLSDARAGLGAIAPRIETQADGLLALRGSSAARTGPKPMLLGAFDPVLLGWRSREFIVGEHEPALISGGLFRPFALVGGHAVATWSIRESRVQLVPFVPISPEDRRELDVDAERVIAYLGL